MTVKIKVSDIRKDYYYPKPCKWHIIIWTRKAKLPTVPLNIQRLVNNLSSPFLKTHPISWGGIKTDLTVRILFCVCVKTIDNLSDYVTNALKKNHKWGAGSKHLIYDKN